MNDIINGLMIGVAIGAVFLGGVAVAMYMVHKALDEALKSQEEAFWGKDIDCRSEWGQPQTVTVSKNGEKKGEIIL